MAIDILPGQGIFLDSAPIIYYFEENEEYFDRIAVLFDAASERNVQMVTSMVTYIEVLTLPEKMGNTSLAAKYRDFLSNSEQLSIYPVNMAVADETVRLRGAYGMRTPDAIQLATARICGADYVVTNDNSWARIEEVNVVLVGDL